MVCTGQALPVLPEAEGVTVGTDFTIEQDAAAHSFLLDAHSERGRDLLDTLATETSEWWGKSLIIKPHEVAAVLTLIGSKGYSIRNRG